MKKHSKYTIVLTIPLLAILIMSIGFGSAYAHKASVIGDYSVEIGWAQEPPIQGIANSIEFVVTYATEAEKQKAAVSDMDSMKMEGMDHSSMKMDHGNDDDGMRMDHGNDDDGMRMDHGNDDDGSMEMMMDHQKRGVSGLEDTIQMTVTLSEDTHTIVLSKTMTEGIYHAEFTPNRSGFPVVNISGMIHDTEINLDMHPEEVEQLSVLSPLKQMNIGVESSEVQCKEGLELFMRVHNDSAICVSSDLGEQLIMRGIASYF